ncbi:MAG TPA: Cof-type HAD-IIB family hydrolase [Chondromyces sp.]|nr:Cof-type HAD-IIB family hydrolase [Chondromyces sp.]
MTVKCIATDMDGTLLNGKLEVSQRNREAIFKAQQAGVEVMVATGRSYSEARAALDEAGIECPIICVNGAETRDKKGEVIDQAVLPKEKSHEIFEILRELDVYFEIYTNHGTYTNNYEMALQIMVDIYLSAHTDIPAEQVREAAKKRFTDGLVRLTDNYKEILENPEHSVYKFLVFSFSQQELKEAEEKLKTIAGIAISSSGKENLEINHTEAQKGIALEKFVKQKNIQMKDVMAIGDNFNDLSMLERVGRPVAMGNAVPEVKAVCAFKTDGNDDDGVGKAIEQALLEQVKN